MTVEFKLVLGILYWRFPIYLAAAQCCISLKEVPSHQELWQTLIDHAAAACGAPRITITELGQTARM